MNLRWTKRHFFARLGMAAAIGASLVGLAATGASAAPAHQGPAASLVPVYRYDIYVQTSNIYAAGTDATVSIKVYGTLRESPGYVGLDNPGVDDLEQGHLDRFGPFYWFDIGDVDFIGLYKGGNGSEWYPSYVAIYSWGTGRYYYCPVAHYYGDGEELVWFDCP